jgi:hypothetical protein
MPPPTNLQRTGNGRGFRFGPQAEKERIEAAAAKVEADRLAERVHVSQKRLVALSSARPTPLAKATQSTPAPRAPAGVTATDTYLTYQTDAPVYAEATGREREIRRDSSKKDIVITATTIEKNRTHQAEFKFSNGNTKFFHTSKFANDESEFPSEYKGVTSEEKESFWEEQWVEIVVDIGAIEDATASDGKFPSVIDMMGKLGPELFKCHFIFVTLVFSNEPADEQWITFVGPDPFAARLDPRSPAVDFDSSPTLSFVAELVKKLQSFQSIRKAGIVIRTPKNDEAQISWGQLQHVLPFYSWWFKSWSLLAQPTGTTPPGHRALFVDHSAVDLLNSEAKKINNLEKEKERAKPRDEWVVIKTQFSGFGKKKED